MSDIVARFESVKVTIEAAAAASGRAVSEVELVAVSKSHPAEAIKEVIDAGHVLFGESRVQEARVKIPLLPARTRWHFIGHLQKNKIRHALPLFELFHGIDSLDLARDMNRIAEECGARPEILLEVNAAGEASKFGFNPDALRRDMEGLLALNRLQINGLMMIPPYSEEPEDSRKYFVALRNLRDELQKEFHVSLGTLSMGMSNDYPIAIGEGATIVRVGTAIFGTRSGRTRQSSQMGSDE